MNSHALIAGSLLVFWTYGIPSHLQAGITFDSAADTLRIVNYPEAWPCTTSRLLATDRQHGWNKVTHDPVSDTFTVNANLVIGHNDGSDTYFQMGRMDHPRETLLVHGNLIVQGYYVQGENNGRWYTARKSVNRLTLGSPDNPEIRATIKIFSAKGSEHTLSIGGRGYGGQLHAYHSTVTAAVQEPEYAIGAANDANRRVSLYGDSIILRQATFSWMAGLMTYGACQSIYADFDCVDSIFENGGTAITDAGHGTIIRGCTLRNLVTGVQDRGSLDMVLIECTFTNNQQNWSLIYSGNGLTCIDCVIHPPRQGDVYMRWDNPQTQQRHYPRFISQRHVIVEVQNAAGAAITNARVEAICEQGEPSRAENRMLMTDSAGRTPGQGHDRALQLTEVIKQATDTPNQPEVKEYTYTIQASATGYRPVELKQFKPQTSWQVIRLVMEKAD